MYIYARLRQENRVPFVIKAFPLYLFLIKSCEFAMNKTFAIKQNVSNDSWHYFNISFQRHSASVSPAVLPQPVQRLNLFWSNTPQHFHINTLWLIITTVPWFNLMKAFTCGALNTHTVWWVFPWDVSSVKQEVMLYCVWFVWTELKKIWIWAATMAEERKGDECESSIWPWKVWHVCD